MKMKTASAVVAITCVEISGCSSGGAATSAPAPATSAPAATSAPTTTSSAPQETATQTETPAPSGKTTIEFKVTTQGKANVAYGTTGGISQLEITKNWSKKVESDQAFDAVNLTVTNASLKKNNVTCEVLIDGKSVRKNSGSGLAAAASCTATIS